MRMALIFALAAIAWPAAAAADHVWSDWDAGTVDGWFPATGAAALAVEPTGGYDGGYLSSTEQPFLYGIVGAINYSAAYTGDFAAHGYVRMQVAVKLLAGSFIEVYFHVRYLDSGHNGWHLPLAVDTGGAEWQFFDIDFDPLWTDPQALAAGWVQETATPTFAETLADAFHTGIKATGTGPLSLGLDHFRLWDDTVASTEMTWSALKALYR